MEKFKVITSRAPSWLQPNVDTDTIAPMQRILNNPDKLGYFCFEPFKFVNGNGDSGQLNPDFVLNQPYFKDCKILIVGKNFGCGSSREPAAIGIAGIGIRCIIGISFSGIFFKNCFQQSLLPIELPEEAVLMLAGQSHNGDFEVNLCNQMITSPLGDKVPFVVETMKKECLLEGLTDVEYTMKKLGAIKAFIEKDKKSREWIYNS